MNDEREKGGEEPPEEAAKPSRRHEKPPRRRPPKSARKRRSFLSARRRKAKTESTGETPDAAKRAKIRAAAAKTEPAKASGGTRKQSAMRPGSDPVSTAVRTVVGWGIELAKLGREMLVIPAQIWLYIAEVIGNAVLVVWRRALRPALLAAWRFARYLLALAERHVTPARAVAAVAIAAAVALAASQWLDYRAISVGNAAYTNDVSLVAPAPDIARDRAGDAHAFVMVPLALAALAIVAVALFARPRSALLLVLVGVAVLAVALIVDVPKGLDEGDAALAYEGAEANLLEGFWVQIACGGVLIACGLLLPRYLRPAAATAPAATSRRRETRKRSQRKLPSLRMPRRRQTLQRRWGAEGKGGSKPKGSSA